MDSIEVQQLKWNDLLKDRKKELSIIKGPTSEIDYMSLAKFCLLQQSYIPVPLGDSKTGVEAGDFNGTPAADSSKKSVASDATSVPSTIGL